MSKAKKKKQPSVTIVPKKLPVLSGVKYDDLMYGEWFIHDGRLCMKVYDIDDQEQMAISIDGDSYDNMCGLLVIPVNIEIRWKKKTL